MKYKYQAKTKEGELQVGFVEAKNRDSAASILLSHDLFVLSIEETERPHWYDPLLKYFSGVKRKDLMVFTRQLATLLEARLPLKSALQTLYEQTSNPTLKEAAFQISEDIDSGLSLSQAMERQGIIFSDFFVSMVRASEATGKLDEVVIFLADYLEKEESLMSKAASAMIYPAIILVLFFIVAFVVVAFIFPQIQPIFSEGNIKLPFFTTALLGLGSFLSRWWFVVLIAVVIFVVFALDYLQTAEGKAFADDLKVRLPIVSRVYIPITITRIATAAALLLRGGIPVAQAVQITSNIVDNTLYKELLDDAAESVRRGEPLSSALSRHPAYFPPIVSQMIVVGEETGHLDQVFTRLANYFTKEADGTISNIVDLIQPVLMIGVGLLVGLLFASILLPLYQLTSSISF